MAYLKVKKIKGKKYYYAVESKRINGKPRIVNQIYLGSIEQLINAKKLANEPPPAKEVSVFDFGLVATCVNFADKLGLVELIDRFVPKRQQGLSVGEYLVIAAISRAVDPISKRACWDWYRSTCLSRLWGNRISKPQLSSQRFWDHMDKVPLKAIQKIEKALSQRLVELYNLDLRFLIYDTTNYYTYIDTFNDRTALAQRGRNKQKRNDLRQVNLALAVTRDFHIPLFHRLYAGNTIDSKSFPGVVDELVKRYALLASHCDDITLVYDKGNNSKKNQEKVDASAYHFIGSLKMNDFPDLAALKTDSERFTFLKHQRLKSVKAYRTKAIVFGKERTIVVTFSQTLYEKQHKTLLRIIARCQTKLQELKDKLQKRLDARAAGQPLPGRPPTRESVESEVRAILKPQYMKQLFDVRLVERDGLVSLEYTSPLGREVLTDIQKTRLGKTILFTDRDDWSTEEIILGYRGQYRIESAFKISKRGHFMAWRPTFHWTDQKLHVHAFYCVLSLLFISIAHRQVWQAGIKIGLPTLEKELKAIQEVMFVQISPSRKSKNVSVSRRLTRMSERQRAIYEALELGRLAPNSNS